MTQHPIGPGEVLLDKYRVERQLGQGGMGLVVAVRHTELDELFAIKVMLRGALDGEDAERRFVREARAAVRLKGEHVVRVHDAGRLQDGSLYMVMEHLTGHDLKTHLAEHGPLPIEEAVSYVLQASEGLAEAHDCGIIHRDIKPANLFLTKRHNGTPCVKILDFGISKQAPTEMSGDITKTGAMLGSPLYMSPEQMVHAREVDGRTDVWALGVVLYELLAGKAPFEGETFTQVVHRVLNTAPKPLREVRPDAPRALEDVVMRCLEKDPNERFENVNAFAEALRKVVGPPPSSRALAFSDTVNMAAGETARLSSAEATARPSTTGMSTSSEKSNRTASHARAGRRPRWLGAVGVLALVMAGLVFFARGRQGRPTPDAATMPPDKAPQVTATAQMEEPASRVTPAIVPLPEQAEAAPTASASVSARASPASLPSSRTSKASSTARPSKPEGEMGAPTPAPTPMPTPAESAKPPKHSLY